MDKAEIVYTKLAKLSTTEKAVGGTAIAVTAATLATGGRWRKLINIFSKATKAEETGEKATQVTVKALPEVAKTTQEARATKAAKAARGQTSSLYGKSDKAKRKYFRKVKQDRRDR